MVEPVTTLHLWGKPKAHQSKPSKDELMGRINKMLPTIVDLSGLTIKDLQRLEKSIGTHSTTEFQGCRTKTDYIAALSLVVPKATTFNRLSLPTLKVLSEVFNDKTRIS